MNGTPTSGFFSDRSNFTKEAKPDILTLAQTALQLYEQAGVKAEYATDYPAKAKADDELAFYATQAELRLGLSIAVDLRRIANALERRHV